MERRDFVQLTGTALGALSVPHWGRQVRDFSGALTPIPTADKKALADVALDHRQSPRRHLRRCADRPLPQSVHHLPRHQGAEHHEHGVVRVRHPGHRQWHLGVRGHERRDSRRHRASRHAGRWRSPGPTPAPDRAGAAGAGAGARRGQPGARRSRRTRSRSRSPRRPTCCWRRATRHCKTAPVSSTRSCFWSTSRSTSPRPTAATSTRTSIGSGRRSTSPSVDTDDREVRNAELAQRAARHGLRVPRRRGRRQGGRARRSGHHQLPRLLRHDRGRQAGGGPGQSEAYGEDGRSRQVRSGARPLPPLAHHPRVGGPPDRARPGAGLRGQLRRHQLRDPRQVAEQDLQVRQPARQPVRRQDPARLAGRGGLRRRRREEQAVGSGARTAFWSTTRPSAIRCTSSGRTRPTAAATPTTGATCSSSACPTCRSSRAARR